MLAPDSIFRCMPQCIHISFRRLMAGLGYAYEAAEFHYARMCNTAKGFFEPGNSPEKRYTGWAPAERISVVTDAWSCIDNLNRCRQLVKCLPYGDPRPNIIPPFLEDLDPARLIRNRIQHLDEDFLNGKNCEKGYPIFGTVSWIDSRYKDGFLSVSVSSGPAIEEGQMLSYQFTGDERLAIEVDRFSLMAFDQKVSVTDLLIITRKFMGLLEIEARRSMNAFLHATAMDRGIPIERLLHHTIADMVAAFAFRRDGEKYKLIAEDSCLKVEVPPGVVKLGIDGDIDSLSVLKEDHKEKFIS